MEMLRRQFGIAEPIRRGMEVKIAAAGEWRPAVLGGASGVHRDILQGRDTEIGWEDVFTGKFWILLGEGIRLWMYFWLDAAQRREMLTPAGNELREVPDFHTEMETKMKMNW